MQKLAYFKEVEGAEWVHEVIAESFDNALELISDDSIVYGGAVRDCLAGKDLLGDLDIIVPYKDMAIVSKTFLSNPKWICDKPLTRSSSTSYGKNVPIDSIMVFRNIDNRTVQLIRAEYSIDANTGIVNVARNVDITCCGVVMTKNGTVYEVVPNAYNDCVEGVLTLNNHSKTFDKSCIVGRIEKLKDRGWKNNININKIKDSTKAIKKKVKRKKDEKDNMTFKNLLSKTAMWTYPEIKQSGGEVHQFNHSGESFNSEAKKYVCEFLGILDMTEFLRFVEKFSQTYRQFIKVVTRGTSSARVYLYSDDMITLFKELADSWLRKVSERKAQTVQRESYDRTSPRTDYTYTFDDVMIKMPKYENKKVVSEQEEFRSKMRKLSLGERYGVTDIGYKTTEWSTVPIKPKDMVNIENLEMEENNEDS